MLGLSKPKCPIEADGKLWIEQRMCWLAEVLGLDRLVNSDVVLPTRDWFPDRHATAEETIRATFERACGFLRLDPARFRLEIHWQEPEFFFVDGRPTSNQILGTYQQQRGGETITIHHHEHLDPTSLVATISHELAHALLLGDRWLAYGVTDHEELTDLTTVFTGLGVFCANSVIREQQGSSDGWHYWRMSKQGYLNEMFYAYGLAVFAWVRDERRPVWAAHLRPNVRQVFRQSLAYLSKTGDCLLGPNDFCRSFYRPHQGQSVAELLTELRSDSASTRLAVLRELRRRELSADILLDPLIQQLEENDWSLRETAAAILVSFGKEAGKAVPTLIHLLYDRLANVRTFALRTLGELGLEPETVVPEAASLLDDSDPHVRHQAAVTLGDFGEHAAEYVPRLTESLVKLRDDTVQAPAYALSKIGQPAWSSIPALVHVIQHGEGASRVYATAALGEIGNRSEVVWETLHQAVFDHDHEVRVQAIGALANLSPLYEESITVLRQALQHSDPDTRVLAASAISQVDGCVPAAVACLAKSLFPPLSPLDDRHSNAFDLSSYGLVIQILKDMSASAVQPLMDLLDHPDEHARRFALWALAHLGGEASPAAERLKADLGNSDPTMVLLAAVALANATASHQESIDTFLRLLSAIDLAEPFDPWFDVCDLGPSARIAPTEPLDRVVDEPQLHRAVIHFAVREMGVPAVAPLIAAGSEEGGQLAGEIAMLLAAISHTVGSDVFQREAAKGDLAIATSRLLQQVRERQELLARARRRFELAATSLPEPIQISESRHSSGGQIRDAMRLLIEGMAAFGETHVPQRAAEF